MSDIYFYLVCHFSIKKERKKERECSRDLKHKHQDVHMFRLSITPLHILHMEVHPS